MREDARGSWLWLSSIVVAVASASCGSAAVEGSTTTSVRSARSAPVELPAVLSLERVVVIVVDQLHEGAAPAARRDLTRQVAVAYARYVYATHLVALRAEESARLATVDEAVRAAVAAGTAPVPDGEIVAQARASSTAAVAAAADDRTSAGAELAALLERDRDAELPPPSDVGVRKASGSIDEWVAMARQQRADEPIERVRREVVAADERLRTLLAAWHALRQDASARSDATVEAALARYRNGMLDARGLLEAVSARAALQARIAELGFRIAQASADLEHAVGRRLARVSLEP